ncbi:hypothetical protein KNU13_gp78 [Gordonia phage Turuncu]|uniref:Uncharacterized protein n=1 Tax=Gordonia phage Turuncu TaxID=2315610 RepID=A0A386KCZ0_9CAUD|nr:hypothetical protein KNU13_gp78 [Gordonia phage Turuncu]AYD82164.1 hypothetical protein SEA_TURUNCU_78 [Gordonia phage Turuncu]
MSDLVATPHGDCCNCGHVGPLIDVSVFWIGGIYDGLGCAKCHQTLMTRRWVVEKPAPKETQ